MNKHYLRIGEVAAFFNVSKKAIRIYDKKDIIKPDKVDKHTGYRYYTVEQVQQLNALLSFKALGFSLNEIKGIMSGGFTNDNLMTVMTYKKMAWQNKIAIAENNVDAIDNIIERLSKSESATKLHALTEDERAWLLVKMVCVEDIGGQVVLSEAIWL